MEQLFLAICAASIVSGGDIVLTDNAIIACVRQEMPALISDGTSFANRGIGAEFNVLARNAALLGIEVEVETAENAN